MPLPLPQFTLSLPKLTLMGAVDILVVAFLIYQLILIVRGTRAAHILLGILALVVIYNLALWMRLELLHSILSHVIPYLALAVIVLFQSELRRTLARIGRQRFFGRAFRRREYTEEILLALARLSAEKIGAQCSATFATKSAQSGHHDRAEPLKRTCARASLCRWIV